MTEEPFITHRSSPTVLLARAGAEDLLKKHLEKHHSCKGKGADGPGQEALSPTLWPLQFTTFSSSYNFGNTTEEWVSITTYIILSTLFFVIFCKLQ